MTGSFFKTSSFMNMYTFLNDDSKSKLLKMVYPCCSQFHQTIYSGQYQFKHVIPDVFARWCY